MLHFFNFHFVRRLSLRRFSQARAETVRVLHKGAIVMDAASGRVLFEDRADEVGPPASVTKLMTFLVVQDCIANGTLTLRTPVTITREDARIAGLRDSTNVQLKEGESFPMPRNWVSTRLMIQSGERRRQRPSPTPQPVRARPLSNA